MLATLVMLVFACVGSSRAEAPSSACPPPAAAAAPTAPVSGAEPAAEQTLVCVGSQAIAGASYSHWLTVAKQANGQSAKGPPALSATELRSEVLAFLISSDWVKGEAEDLNISVSAAAVKKNFDRIRAAQFPKSGEFEAFLRTSGQTVADLLFRVELNLLSQRIQKHVVARQHSAAGQQRALSQFVKAFKAKWQAQTYCAPEYAVADCGHVQGTV